MEFVVYILYSSHSDKIYIGFTSDLISRFHSHNSLSHKGYTTRFRPWAVIFCEYHTQKADALNRDMYFKSGMGRKWIKEQIREYFPFNGYIGC